MDMTVDKETRFEPPHEEEKRFEPRVAPIFPIVDPKGRGMGEEDIDPPAVKNTVIKHPGYQLHHFEKHLYFGELVDPCVVSQTAS